MASTYFITGTVYTITYPDGMEDKLDELYDEYWMNGEVSDLIKVEEGEVLHYWEGETV